MKVIFQHADVNLLQRLKDGLTPEKLDALVERVALRTEAKLKEATPKKWFGQVRRAWNTVKPAEAIRAVQNLSKIMIWLEEGTQDHGPVNAKALFIPLTLRAVNATQSPELIGYVNDDAGRGIIIGRKTRKTDADGNAIVRQDRLVYGVDYVLAKRVKGIKAMHIVENQRRDTQEMLSTEIKDYIRSLLHA